VLELFLVRLSRGPSIPPTVHTVRTPNFFDEQMSAFWVWLRFHPELSGGGTGFPAEPPVELPIVLHGLLHPNSRLEALRLLACFVDLGVGAVHFTLLVGARPYLTKLLSHDDAETTPEVSPLALLVWTKMLTFDSDGKEGVLNKDAYRCFFNLAKAETLPNYSRALAILCLSIACHNKPPVKVAVHKLGALDLVANVLATCKRPLLLWMAALLCAEVCRDCPEVAKDALLKPITQVLLRTLGNTAQAVRGCAVYALGCILRAAAPLGKPAPAACLRIGQKVERRATGQAWGCGYVNSVDPLEVDFLSWAEVRPMEVALAPPGGLDVAVPLFRRFLGLGTTDGLGSGGNEEALTLLSHSGPESKPAQGDKLLWLASSMIWHFCVLPHSDTPQPDKSAPEPVSFSAPTPGGAKELVGNGNTCGSLSPTVPDCGILNESSMLVRHELISAFAPWVHDLTANHATSFAYFDSLPSPPWDADSLAVPVPLPSPVLRSTPSCPSISHLNSMVSVGSDAFGMPEVESPDPFTSESIMYEWTVNCLQQPNAISHAVHHDLSPLSSLESPIRVAVPMPAPVSPEGSHWDPEASFLPSTPRRPFRMKSFWRGMSRSKSPTHAAMDRSMMSSVTSGPPPDSPERSHGRWPRSLSRGRERRQTGPPDSPEARPVRSGSRGLLASAAHVSSSLMRSVSSSGTNFALPAATTRKEVNRPPALRLHSK